MDMQCGWCSADVKVTEEQMRTARTVPCTTCNEGGVDLVHARRHSND